jgi:maleylacetate reductase
MHEERIDQRRVLFGKLDESLRALALAEPIAVVAAPRWLDTLDATGAVSATAAYTDVRPHNPREGVLAAGRLVDQSGSRTLIAIGSSSAIDLGKAVSDGRTLTLVVIPTALGGAEMSRGYGFLEGDVKGGGRLKTPPPVVIYDSTLLASLPQRELGSIGINAWAHCIEAAYAQMQHATGLAAAIVAGGRLPALLRAAAKVRDWTLDAALLQAAHLAGYALDTRSMGLHHAICHVLGGLTQIPHGIVNAIVLPHAVRANARLDPNVVEAVGDWFGVPDLAGEAEAIARAFALPRSFKELGALPDLVDRAVPRVMASPLLPNNAAPVDEATVRAVVTAAYGG